MTPPRSVTPSDAEMLAIADRLTESMGKAPTVRELAAAVGLSTPGPMHRHLQRMRRIGLVEWEPRRGRSLRVVHTCVSGTETDRGAPGT